MKWYLQTLDGGEEGPYEQDDLLRSLQAGRIKGSARVRSSDDTKWQVIAEHPELRGACPAPQPPPEGVLKPSASARPPVPMEVPLLHWGGWIMILVGIGVCYFAIFLIRAPLYPDSNAAHLQPGVWHGGLGLLFVIGMAGIVFGLRCLAARKRLLASRKDRS